MKRVLLPSATLALLVLAASCSTPDSRVRSHQAEFNSWPPEVQHKVQAGQIELGFTPAMVRVALGDPERVFSRTTAQGVEEGWVYADRHPRFSIGIGVGSVHRSSAVGGGVTVGDAFREGEAMRVIFANGRVVAIERRH